MKKTRFLSAHLDANILLCANIITKGGLVAFPTETVYGLGALGLCEESVKKIYEAKNRPSSNPLILHVADIKSALELFDFQGSHHPALFRQRFDLLAHHFWPGPLTIVGKKSSLVPDVVTASSPKVAVRIPSHPIALKLLARVAQPVAAPSANLFTRPSPTTGEHVLMTLDGRVETILDAGATEYGIESTVIDIDGIEPKILRHGAISASELENLIPGLSANLPGYLETNSPSPGQCEKHYSPKIPSVALASEAQLASAWFSSAGLILRQATEAKLSSVLGQRISAHGPLKSIPNDPKGFAKELFGAFYEMENCALDKLLIEDLSNLSTDGAWAAVCDRLSRAKSGSQA